MKVRNSPLVVALLVLAAHVVFGFSLVGCSTAGGSPAATITVPMLPAWRAPADASPVPWLQVLGEVGRLAPAAQFHTSDATFTRINHAFALELVAWTRAFISAEEHTHAAGLHYTSESFDCDKFAKAFTLAVELAAGRAGVRAQPLAARIFVRQSAAFGGIPAVPAPNDGHALVALATDAGIFVVEPQTGAVVALAQYPNRATVWRVSIGG